LIKALEFICRVFHRDIPTVTGLVPLQRATHISFHPSVKFSTSEHSTVTGVAITIAPNRQVYFFIYRRIHSSSKRPYPLPTTTIASSLGTISPPLRTIPPKLRPLLTHQRLNSTYENSSSNLCSTPIRLFYNGSARIFSCQIPCRS